MPTTGGRSRGRQGARPHAQGAAAEHLPKIVTCSATVFVVVVFVLVMTPAGHDIDAATQRFMLFYAGVFALLGLTGSVLVGLLATDRVFLTPGHRVMAQAVHRAFSFGALAFLVIHIVTEILAQRVHVIDAFIPFLSPFRTFYIGLGTIASDLMILIVVSSILRKRFTGHGRAWRWRAIHYSAYAAFVLGVLHGLLGGRTAKPYVDWSYGLAIALTALGLVVRFLATSLRPREALSAHPGADRAGASAAHRSSPLHAAAMSLAQAQLGATVQVLPGGAGLPGTGPRTALPPAQGWSPNSGPLPALGAAPAYAGEAAYADLGFVPLGAPPFGDRGLASLGPPGQPLYEPGYDGPPRFMGAPRGHLPQDDVSSHPYGGGEYPGGRRSDDGGRRRTGAHRLPAPYGPGQAGPTSGDRNTGPMPRAVGPAPGADSGPMPRVGTGPLPRLGSGSAPRADSGPLPRLGSGPMPRADSGPLPRLGSGPMPRADSGPSPRVGSGPLPRGGARPGSRADSGPMPRLGTGSRPRADSGPLPRVDAAPLGPSGPLPRANPGARPDVPATGPRPTPRRAARPPRRAAPADPRYREPRSDRSDEW